MAVIPGRLVAWASFVTAFATLNYVGRFAGDEPPSDILYRYGTAVFGLIQFLVVLGIVVAIARPRMRELLALRRPSSWWLAVRISAGIFVGIMILGAVLEPLLNPGEEQGLLPEGWDSDRAGAFAANFAVIALLAPVVEELTFRGLGFSLLRRFGRWIAIAVVAVAFGLAHGLVAGLPLLVAFGAGLAYLRSRTESVYPAIALHGIFNSVVLTLSVTM
ncbi:MAG: CPBP family intramembrane metalloprotease [Actinobacteria bacterium]|nr:CPBP family intramembrane metalloprotease [Actinomycetota bacterium]